MLPTVDNLVNDPLEAPLADVTELAELQPLLKAAAERDAGACWIYADRIQDDLLRYQVAAWLSRCGANGFDPIRGSRHADAGAAAWYRTLAKLVANNTINKIIWPKDRRPDPLPANTSWPLPRWHRDGGRTITDLFTALVIDRCVDSLKDLRVLRRPEGATLTIHFLPANIYDRCATGQWQWQLLLHEPDFLGHVGVIGRDVLDAFTAELSSVGERQDPLTDLRSDPIYRAALDFVRRNKFPEAERYAATQIFVDWYCFRGHEIGYFPSRRGIAIRARGG